MNRSLAKHIGCGLLVVAVLSYLAAIWTSETVSEHFGLTGVLFMFSGIAAFVIAPFMPERKVRR